MLLIISNQEKLCVCADVAYAESGLDVKNSYNGHIGNLHPCATLLIETNLSGYDQFR